jgi:hypothetical protein
MRQFCENERHVLISPDGGIPAKAGQGPTHGTLDIEMDFNSARMVEFPQRRDKVRHAGLKLFEMIRIMIKGFGDWLFNYSPGQANK